MEKFVKGDAVVLPFPFSDLSASKKRPALVVAVLDGDDVILSQITTRANQDSYSVTITDQDFISGGLRQESAVRTNRLFTGDSKIISKCAGKLKVEKLKAIIQQIIKIISAE